MCGNILCWKVDRPRGPCNEIRVLEFILCVVCFGISLHFIDIGKVSHTVSLVFFSAIIFVVITLVDIIVITTWFPIGWRAWIVFSLTAALFFFTCTGLSFVIMHPLYYIGTIFYVITAIVFFLDSICIVWLVQGTEDYVSKTCSTVCKASQIVPLNKQPPLHAGQMPVKCRNIERSQQTDSTANIRRPEPRCHRSRTPPPTYGGTFHMSKNTTPLPSPEPVTILEEEEEEYDTFAVEQTSTRKVRTVAIMVKMGPRKVQEVDLTPLKSPFEKEGILVKKPPIKRLKRVQYACNRDFKYDTTAPNSPRTTIHINGNDKSSPRNNEQV